MMDPLLQRLCYAVREAGSILLEAREMQMNQSAESSEICALLEKSGHANFVTVYDQKVQTALVQSLETILPEAHFIVEENGQDQFTAEHAWGWTFIIDPIDGTSNFMKGYDPSVISVGLLKDGIPEIGIVFCPVSGQLFYAQKGKGAFENGRPIHVTGEPLSNCLVSLGTAPYYEDCREAVQKSWSYYLDRSIDIRRSGSAAYDLCMVASGRIGLFYEPRLCLWDYAAGACILEEAGGVITDPCGKPMTYRGPSGILARGSGIAKEVILWNR